MTLSAEKKKELIRRAADIRQRAVEIIINGGGGHLGGDLSSADVVVNIYDFMKHNPNLPHWSERDQFILSKGHSAETLYAILEYYGYVTKEEVDTYGKFGSKFGGHPTIKINGVEASTGSLGHGLGLSVGKALALKRDHKPNRIFCMTGDGEIAEGSVWEAAMSAANYKLTNLTWIIDRNGLQISGSTEDVMALENLQAKTEAFGWHTIVIDGHDHDAIRAALEYQDETKPTCIISKSIKSKGLKIAENKPEWHHKTPTAEQFEEMKKDLEEIRKEQE